MKRQHIDLIDIAAYDNLLLATWKAAKGKQQREDVRNFFSNIEQNIQQLSERILSHKTPVGEYKYFYINDPKKRLIHAACFEDRILHHAILNQTEPIFEKGLIEHSYACRPNKGSHRAVQQVQKNVQRFKWFVKVDVAGYFPSINHHILMKLLETRFKGDDFLALLWRIIDSYHATMGYGLPIGSLTSQHFANFYLNSADRWLQQHLDVRAVVRYMDDTIWWCDSKRQAKRVLQEYQGYLSQTRDLKIKPALQVNQSQRGVTFCGYRILKGCMRLTLRKQRRYKTLFQYWEQQWLDGMINDLKLQQVHDAVVAPLLHCESLAWRKQCLRFLNTRYNG